MCPRTGRVPYFFTCPDCGAKMRKTRKGWGCPNPACAVTRVRGRADYGRITKVVRAARRRAKPLTDRDLIDLSLQP